MKRILFDAIIKLLKNDLDVKKLEAIDEIHKAGIAVLRLLPVQPRTVRDLAYKKLHVFPFKDVPLCWRRAYEEACIWEILVHLERLKLSSAQLDQDSGPNEHLELFRKWLDDSIKLCDRAIIFTGAPRRRRLIDTLLEWIEAQSHTISMSIQNAEFDRTGNSRQYDHHPEELRGVKRRRLSNEPSPEYPVVPKSFLFSQHSANPCLHRDRSVERQDRPSLHKFENHVQTRRVPLVLTNALTVWPALELWKNPEYWMKRTLGGRRLVPIEIGKSYTDNAWSQQILSFEEFMRRHLLHASTAQDGDGDVNRVWPPSSQTGYLAQHDLFAQIPSLRNDIAIPDYCYIDVSEAVDASSSEAEAELPSGPLLNIWLGPADTVSPAHTDPHHNILCQVVGRKYIRLFAPSQASKMYPMTAHEHVTTDEWSAQDQPNAHGVNMGNTSRVDVGSFVPRDVGDSKDGSHFEFPSTRETERAKFPDHESADYLETVLQAGECVYIPKGWWHYVRSLETSCSVSFWWD